MAALASEDAAPLPHTRTRPAPTGVGKRGGKVPRTLFLAPVRAEKGNPPALLQDLIHLLTDSCQSVLHLSNRTS